MTSFEISIGRSRLEKRWQNTEMTWDELCERLKSPHRTHETYKEYMAMKPAQQDNIKDIGGFVGGNIAGGRRKKGSVLERSLITLDIDHAPDTNQFWDTYRIMFDWKACIYSTHKHCNKSPRLRLVIPLKRLVNPDEYEALGRYIADMLNIEFFDTTTYQVERLMYWPSASKDGQYYFNKYDGNLLDPDRTLRDGYNDWTDSSQWPRALSEKDKIRNEIDKQADPLTKSGIIGAFCRAYSPEETMEKFLPGIYTKSDTMENRYTYKHGSTANGVIIYDEKFIYSHHATDPISGLLCNSFDLVRLHKFRHLDERYDDALGGQRPSFVAMQSFASEDKKVKKIIGQEKIQEAQDVFAEYTDATEELLDNDDWMEEMEIGKDGNYLSTINNVVLIFENDPGLKGRFRFNMFENRGEIHGELPWDKSKEIRASTDSDMSFMRHYLELIYGLTAITKIDDALVIVERRWKYHPIQDYIKSVEWDGVERAELITVQYLGAVGTDYIKTTTRKALLACVARVFEPGCKFDEVPVIIGDQGIGKSTLLYKLANNGKWFSDSLIDMKSKDALEQLQGAWIIELGELSVLKRNEVETVKHFVAKRHDRFRVSYGKKVEKFMRQCVFWGTTNEQEFLKDITGNRRFWPAMTFWTNATLSVWDDLTPAIVSQIWAEVYTWYLMGEELHLDDDMKAEAKVIQWQHMEKDERSTMLSDFLDKKITKDWYNLSPHERMHLIHLDSPGTIEREFVSAAEVWCEFMGKSHGDMTAYNSREVHKLLKQLKGWKYTGVYKPITGYGRQRIYERIKGKANVQE